MKLPEAQMFKNYLKHIQATLKDCRVRRDPAESQHFQELVQNHKTEGWDLKHMMVKLLMITSSKSTEYIKELLKAGADPNATMANGLLTDSNFNMQKACIADLDLENLPKGVVFYPKTILSIAISSTARREVRLSRRGEEIKPEKFDQNPLILIKAGAKILDDHAILRAIEKDSYQSFGWFSQHPKFQEYFLSNPIFAVQMVKECRAGSPILDYYRLCGGRFDIVLPDGSNLLFHANGGILKKVLLNLPEMKPLIKAKGPLSQSLLHQAHNFYSRKHPEIIDKLINEYQLDPNEQDENGNTPVMNCVQKAGSSNHLLRLLLRFLPLSCPVRNNDGKTLLDLVREKAGQNAGFAAVDHAVKSWERQWAMETVTPTFKNSFSLPEEVLDLIRGFISVAGHFEPISDEEAKPSNSSSGSSYNSGSSFSSNGTNSSSS